MIIATDATMTDAATIVRAVSGSPASAHPSSTATTGFTYAYVDTFAGVVARRSHAYAENATSDPKDRR